MKRRNLILMSLGLVCTASWAAAPDLLSQISQQVDQHAVIRANFVQTRKMVALKRPVVSRGKLIYARKEGVFWLIEQPLQVSYWFGEQKVIELTADGQRREQDIKTNPALAYVGRVMRSMLGAQTEALKETFHVSIQGSAAQWELELVPKQAQLAQYIKTIKVAGGKFIEHTSVEEKSGDITTTRFSESQSLTSVPASEIQRFTR